MTANEREALMLLVLDQAEPDRQHYGTCARPFIDRGMCPACRRAQRYVAAFERWLAEPVAP